MRPATKILAAGSMITAAGMLLGSWAPFEFHSASFAEVLEAYCDAGKVGRSSRSDAVANTALSIPFAFVFIGFLISLKPSLGWRIMATLLTLLATALVSLACELPQGWLPQRIPSAQDTLAQITGAAVGCTLWWLVGSACLRSLNQMVVASQAALRVQAGLSLAVLLVLFWSILPGQVLVSPVDYGKKWATGRIELVPFTRPISTMSDILQLGWCVLIGIPLGLWAAHLVRVFFRRRPSLAAQLLVILALGILPEILQIPIATRFASATDALFTMFGVGMGYVVARGVWADHDAQFSERPAAAHRRSIIGDPAFWR